MRMKPSLLHYRLQSKFQDGIKEEKKKTNYNDRGTIWCPLVILKTMIAVQGFGHCILIFK